MAVKLMYPAGLADKINAYPAHLLGGQQRRVVIARIYPFAP